MKKIFAVLALTTALCAHAAEPLSVAASAVPHAELLEFVKPALAEQGVDLQIKIFTDYVQPNVQVAEGRITANFFQHQPYLDEFNKGRGTDLVSVANVHVEPFGIYSHKLTSLDAIAKRATVAIPNDATNGGRALLLLEQAGLIRLKPDAGTLATPRDIIDNPHKLRIRELEAATLPRVLDQVDLALINTNYALEAGLNPLSDALAIEGPDSPYVNILVTRRQNAEDESVLKLVKALHSDELRTFILEKYRGAVVPAF